ncbi:DUF4184 family protein [Paenibacillus glucanolyticus]|uniref:DUF4184 family protein n=1 Tax=Paenibacillus glucanolyticus TaxID=59843 RepID=UPI0034CF4F99
MKKLGEAMPFTFAHPVITMPWWRKKLLPVSALVIGCMAPDFEYFIRFRAASVWSHEGLGVILFNLPMIVLLYLLFECVARPVLHVYLPSWFPYRWSRERKLPISLKGWLLVLVMGMTGVATHLLWDQFTHKGAWLVNHIPLLTQTIQMGSIHIPVYKLCQHGSTLLGLGLIVWWIHRHLYVMPEKRKYQHPILPFWCVWAAIFIVMMVMAMITVVDGDGLAFILQLVVPAISSFLLALLMTCLVFWSRAR